MDAPLPRRLLAEMLGSAFLAALVIGSGIAVQTLSPGDVGLQLFENAAATAVGLFTIILMFGPVSGGHFNPVVSLADAGFGGIGWRDALAYIPVQVAAIRPLQRARRPRGTAGPRHEDVDAELAEGRFSLALARP